MHLDIQWLIISSLHRCELMGQGDCTSDFSDVPVWYHDCLHLTLRVFSPAVVAQASTVTLARLCTVWYACSSPTLP